MYSVTKKHEKGMLKGIETHEITGIKFQVGKNYGNYICTDCKELDKESIVQIEATRPSPYYGTAFASGTLEYISKVKKYWRSIGYYNIHMWTD